MEYIVTRDDELYHYGVMGMKWGHRKAPAQVSETRRNYDNAKAAKKAADKEYNKSFSKAYNHNRHYTLNKQKRAASDARWEDAWDKAQTANQAKRTYQNAKATRRDKINAEYQKAQNESTRKDRFMYNDATRKRAAKYVVDNNMSYEDAKKRANKDAIRNTAILLGAYGAVTVASGYMYMNN